jgi:lysozyme-like protein
MTSHGELAGYQMQPRDLASLCYSAGPKWKDALRLREAVQVCLSESQGYVGARNDNLDELGAILSRDVGLFQINISADQVGTTAEAQLYDPEYNVFRAYQLYDRRGWQPWVAWSKGIAWDDTYVKRAVRGVGNFLGADAIDHPVREGKTRSLTNPVLDYEYRVIEMANAHRRIVALARQLKPIGGLLVDAKANEIIGAASIAAGWQTR